MSVVGVGMVGGQGGNGKPETAENEIEIKSKTDIFPAQNLDLRFLF